MSKIIKAGPVVDWRDLLPKVLEADLPPYEHSSGEWIIGFLLWPGNDHNLPLREVVGFRPSADYKGSFNVLFELPMAAVDSLTGRGDYVLFDEVGHNVILSTDDKIFWGAYNAWAVVRWGLLYGVMSLRQRLYLGI